ncbi:uncharacterized protein LOC144166601 isoform X2 [Haemaphysalis longicornis]
MPSDAIGSVVVEDTGGSTPDMKILRVNLYSPDDADDWFKKYCDESCTSWIVQTVRTMCTRMVYHKVWECHLSHRNKTRKSLRPSCPARLDVKIKKVNASTRRNDRFLRWDPPLAAVIKLIREHNHPVGRPDAPRSSRPTAETRARFEGYFESGMTPAQALHHNENLLAAEAGGKSAALHAGFNPRHSAVYTWHKQWREAKYGLRENPLPKLQERAASFAASGMDVHTCGTGDGWAVLVVTPIMRRAQQLKSARELIFVDSVSSCDKTKSTVTCLLAPSRAGAVPIAVLIHSEQSTEGYQMAFELLRSTHPQCFGGCELEKPALSHVWPRARQLLCHVRAQQCEWRWLTDAQNGVPKGKRHHCLSAFQKILKARGEEELAWAVEEAQCGTHNAYVERINDFLTSEEEWSLACRAGVTTLDQASIDYSEASVRVLKDILLSQVVAWNAVVLIDFIITELETYLEARLLRHIDPREVMRDTTYEKLLRGGEACVAPCPGGNILFLESERAFSFRNKYGRTECEVHPELGFCTCWSGSQGAFCRHQIAVLKDFGGDHFPRAPELTLRDYQLMAKLALGDKALPPMFFLSSSGTQSPSGKDVAGNSAGGSADECASGAHDDHSYVRGSSDAEMLEAQESPNRSLQGADQVLEAQEKKYQTFASLLRKVHELAKGCPGYLTLLDRIITDLRGVDTSTAAYNLFLRVSASSSLEKRRRAAPTIKRPRKVLRTNLKCPDGTWAFDAVSGSTDPNSSARDPSDASNVPSPLADAELEICFSDGNDASSAVSPLSDDGVSLFDAENDASNAVSHVMDTDICLSDANCASDAASHLAGADASLPDANCASSAVSHITDAALCLSDANDASNAVSHVMDTSVSLPVGCNTPKVVSSLNDTNVCLPDANSASKVASNFSSTNVCLLGASNASNVVSCLTNTDVFLPPASDAPKTVSYLPYRSVRPSDVTNVCLPDANNASKVASNFANTNVCLLGANNASNVMSRLTSTDVCLPPASDAPKTVSYLTYRSVCPSDADGASRVPPRITVIEMRLPSPVYEVQCVGSIFGASKSS